MPAKSAKQYGYMQMIAHNKKNHPAGPSKEVAKKFIHETSKDDRSNFAKALLKKRKK